LVITVILLIATAAFVGYYVFFVNIGRSIFSWVKFEHDNSLALSSGQCSDSTSVSDSDKKKAVANAAVQELIKQNQSSQKNCAASS
jgi:hypothetical protein